MPKISIIVPVYNVEKYIHRCINSILAQTFTDFELILVNDGSPDKSGEICDEYAEKDNRIIVIHKKNGGPAEARNYGLNIAQGEYMGFVDSDDYIDSTMYDKLYAVCTKNDDIKLSICGRFDIYENKKETSFTINQVEKWSNEEAIRNLLTWNNIDSSPCDKLFHKSLFDTIRFPTNKNVEDIYTIYKLINLSKRTIHLGEPLYYYCHRPNSRSVEEFSMERFDILEVSTEIRGFVLETYPNLIEEADSFYYANVLFLYKLLWPSPIRKAFQRSYKEVGKIINANIYRIITNKYIGIRKKVISLLIFMKLYGASIKLKGVQRHLLRKF